ncbi:MAG: hypothetical protein KME47_24855 [Nodosilinea sp. WJT8-NPBG4]|jgi:hypothetical protein|nr:hypothetical protein [Nodosilinea sp. WJT8-NPBG4]
MSFFDFFHKNSSETAPEAVDHTSRQRLVEVVLGILRDESGRIAIEDAISAAATIVGERCIDAAGDYSLRDHDRIPGSGQFSTKVNDLICGDVLNDINQIPRDSVIGILRDRLDMEVYTNEDFPNLSQVFKNYADRAGNPANWGKVPLSVPEGNLPAILPLRFGFETRPYVDEILYPIREDRSRCLRVATESLAEILMRVASGIDRRLALTLAIETMNGMSKIAPMTVKAMQEIQQNVDRPAE